MKATFIILLFPSVACAFYNGIPYKKTEICEKIKNDHETAMANYGKANAGYKKSYADYKKADADYDKAIEDIKKYCVGRKDRAIKGQSRANRKGFESI